MSGSSCKDDIMASLISQIKRQCRTDDNEGTTTRATAAAAAAWLVNTNGKVVLRMKRKCPKDYFVGRSPDNDVVINAKNVSRVHVRLAWDGSAVMAQLVSTTLKMVVNETIRVAPEHQRADKRIVLNDGDDIRIGPEFLTVLYNADEPMSQAPVHEFVHDFDTSRVVACTRKLTKKHRKRAFNGVQSASRNPQSVSAIRAVSNLVPPIRHSSKTRLKPRDLYAEQGSFLALHDELITPAQIRYEWAMHQSNSKANSNVHHLRSPAIYIQGGGMNAVGEAAEWTAPLAASSPTNSSPLSARLDFDWSSTHAQPHSSNLDESSDGGSPAVFRDRPVEEDTPARESSGSSLSRQLSQLDDDSDPDIIIVSERYL